MVKNNEIKGAVFFRGSSWYHRLRIRNTDGSIKWTKKGGFNSEEEAMEAYEKAEAKFMADSEDYERQRNGYAGMTLSGFLTAWFENEYAPRVRTNTRALGRYVLEKLILPSIKQDTPLSLVNTAFLDALLVEAAKVTESSGNKCREFLYLAFEDARAEKIVDFNPVKNCQRYLRRTPRVTVYSKDKLKVFLEAAQNSNWYLEVLLALFVGLRKGEIRGLKFSDFDIEHETVLIERQIVDEIDGDGREESVARFRESPPKTTNSHRILRVPHVVIRELQKRQEMVERNKNENGDGYVDNGYVSCQMNGYPRSSTSFNTALSRITDRVGLPHITPHGLRHMFATILMENNVPLVKISALLGHSSINTTFEYYCEVMDENEKILNFMNEKLGGRRLV
ncbi:MAG: site-specific integrase [Lachnospiraceae bacterium]|nr:site-specific integrase [Lachnospiraceae bacterium]